LECVRKADKSNDSRARRDRNVWNSLNAGHDVRAAAAIAAETLRGPSDGPERQERVGHEELLVLGRDADLQEAPVLLRQLRVGGVRRARSRLLRVEVELPLDELEVLLDERGVQSNGRAPRDVEPFEDSAGFKVNAGDVFGGHVICDGMTRGTSAVTAAVARTS